MSIQAEQARCLTKFEPGTPVTASEGTQFFVNQGGTA